MISLSKEGLGLLKGCEGCSLTSYQDQGGVWTIGYGSTIGVLPNMKITAEAAESRLLADLKPIYKAIDTLVTYKPLSQNKADALIIFIFNVGISAFSRSTLLKMLNAGNLKGAGEQFLRWNRIGSVVNAGLTNRRNLEKHLFEA